jgi:uncharacterized protein (TIGR03000 family)
MRQSRVGAAALFGAAALLLVPATASAQVSINIGRYGGGYYGTMPGYYYGTMPGYYGYSPYSTYGAWQYPGTIWGSYTRGAYTIPNYAYTVPNYAATDFYYNAPAMSSSGAGSYYSYGAPAEAETRDSVRLNVRLPDPNAEVWVEGKLTNQRGTLREFVSPPLNPDKSYTYDVRARWTENGKDVERTRTVPVRANGNITVDFTAPANNSRVDEIDKGSKEKGSKDSGSGTRSSDKDRPDKQ